MGASPACPVQAKDLHPGRASFLTAWIIAILWISNFTYGALLPIVPRLSVATAGLAFTSFSLFKVFCLAPAGWLSDRMGHMRAMTVAIALQALSLGIMLALPDAPWIARIIEGIALAQGTVSTISLLRIVCPDPIDFAAKINRAMGIGGLGFILGPLFGYMLLPYGVTIPLVSLLALNLVFLAIQVLWSQTHSQPMPAPESPAQGLAGGQAAPVLLIIVGFAAAKALSQGWQPILAWWATNDLQLSAGLSGLSFILLGIAFSLGAVKRIARFHWAGIAGLAFLEASLRGLPLAWWPSMLLMGYWFGAYVTTAVARLGWNKPEALGQFNSRWMMATDLPMAIVPVILWEWREPAPGLYRVALAAALIVIAGIGLWESRKPGSSFS